VFSSNENQLQGEQNAGPANGNSPKEPFDLALATCLSSWGLRGLPKQFVRPKPGNLTSQQEPFHNSSQFYIVSTCILTTGPWDRHPIVRSKIINGQAELVSGSNPLALGKLALDFKHHTPAWHIFLSVLCNFCISTYNPYNLYIVGPSPVFCLIIRANDLSQGPVLAVA